MSDELTELKTKVDIYEKQILTYNGKIDKIDKKTYDTHEKILKLPCGEHQTSIDFFRESFKEIRTMTNRIFASIIATAVIMILVWGFKELSGVKLMKSLVAKEMSKIAYAAELYRID